MTELDRKIFPWLSFQTAISQFEGFKNGSPDDHVTFIRENMPTRDFKRLAESLKGERVSFRSSNARSSSLSLSLTNIFGVFHGRAASEGAFSSDVYPVVIAPDLTGNTILPVSETLAEGKPNLSIRDLVSIGVKTFYIPLHYKKEDCTLVQRNLLNMVNQNPDLFSVNTMGQSLDFFVNSNSCSGKVQVMFILPGTTNVDSTVINHLVDIEGVFFDIRELLNGILTPISRFATKPLSVTTKSTSEKSAGRIPLIYGVPTRVQTLHLLEIATHLVKPNFRVSLTGKIKVRNTVTSTLSIKTEYTKVLKNLQAKIPSSSVSAIKIFNVVSYCVERIENSPIWCDNNLSFQIPKMDPYQEGLFVFDSLSKLAILEEKINYIASSDEITARRVLLKEAILSILTRIDKIVAYLYELDCIETLLQQQENLTFEASKQTAEKEKLIEWDSLAEELLVSNYGNDVAVGYSTTLQQYTKMAAQDLEQHISVLHNLSN